MKSRMHDLAQFDPITSSKGGLFDVGPNLLDRDIGRRVRFHPDPSLGILANIAEFEIVAVQRDYSGRLCYRVQAGADDFGRVAHPSSVYFV